MLNLALVLLLPCSIAAQSLTTLLTNPTPIPCPANTTLIRSAGPPGNQTLSPGETKYISDRASKVLPGAWKTYLDNVKCASKTPLPSYVSDILTDACNGTLPKVGIALPGGSYRAALFGASVTNSLDGRNTTAAETIGTGGLLQAATYLSGLSAGAWLLTALSQANFPTIEDLVFPPENINVTAAGGYGGFNAQVDLTAPSPDPNATLAYIELLISEVSAKRDAAGFPVTVADVWSRALSRHFVNGSAADDIVTPGLHGAGILFSGLPSLPSFMSHEQPFPLVMMDSFSPNPNISMTLPGQIVSLTNEIWEANPYEMGSYDPMLGSFIPMELLGSTNSSSCVAGYDQLSFVASMSSDVFALLNVSEAALLASPSGAIFTLINDTFPGQDVRLDSAIIPNPFQGVNPDTYSNTNETFVALVDGATDGQDIPLQPLLVQARGLDTIIAIDAGDDLENNFSNGSKLVNSAIRASLFGTTYPFPSVPSTEIFLEQNLTLRPTFFGCNDSSTPLIIYIANGGPPVSGAAPVTNTTNLQTTYTVEAVREFLDQAFEIVVQGAPVSANGTDPKWGVCLACAVVDRARERLGAEREGVCATCLERYCWNGDNTSANTTGGA